MTNLYDLERHRLKLYGEMLKNDLVKQKEQEKYEKEEKLRLDCRDLEQHLENTRMFQRNKRAEVKGLNKSLQKDNMMLSTMKQTVQMPHTYAEEGPSFIQDIDQMDSHRLDRLKQELRQQASEHHNQQAHRKMINDKISHIESLQNERHVNRIKEWQINSVRNYEGIKRKHQQDMNMYDKHKKMVEENDHYRDELENFTNSKHGLFDRYSRNDYSQRQASVLENQHVVKKQMEELERRKSQENIQYKRSIGDLEQSMLKSMLVKPQNNDYVALNNELKSQMWEENNRKRHEKEERKEKQEINTILGGVQSRQREKILMNIDKSLGIPTSLNSQTGQLNSSRFSNHKNQYDNFADKRHQNPERRYEQSKETTQSKMNMSYESKAPNYEPTSYDPANNERRPRGESGKDSNRSKPVYKSFDVVSGKTKYYNQE